MSIRLKKNNLPSSAGRIQAKVDKVPKMAFAYWRKITPKLTGNAKRKTVLKGDTIHARYPYAEVLDEGYSRKAPRGMSLPTFEYIKKIMGKAVRKKKNG